MLNEHISSVGQVGICDKWPDFGYFDIESDPGLTLYACILLNTVIYHTKIVTDINILRGMSIVKFQIIN